MNTAFKIIAFIFLLNLSAGIMSTALPNLPYKVTYSESEANKLNSSGVFSGETTPAGIASDPVSFGDRILDILTLGWYERIKAFVQSYLFGVTNILLKVFGGYFKPYKSFFDLAILLTYAIGLISLWVGKTLNR